MAHHKLLLDDDPEEDFSLIAIHCSEEAYKMAFMLNKHAILRLKRRKEDLDFSYQGHVICFPIFEFDNELTHVKFNLVSNKYRLLTKKADVSEGLFDNFSSEKLTTINLLPEHQKVDYFLKVHSEYQKTPIKNLVSSINEIEQVISAYYIDNEKIKSKNNLIFN